MMAKYRGKYKKSRTCVHAEEVMMILVRVSADCPHGIVVSSGTLFSDKELCEACTAYIKREMN